MRRNAFSLVAATVMSVAAVGLRIPDAASDFFDRRIENIPVDVEIEQVSLRYMTEKDVCDKLLLVRDEMIQYQMNAESGMTRTQTEAANIVIDYMSRIFDMTYSREVYAEPVFAYFENGESLRLWHVNLYTEWSVCASFILDDAGGTILSFEIRDEFGTEFGHIMDLAAETADPNPSGGLGADSKKTDLGGYSEGNGEQLPEKNDSFDAETVAAGFFADALLESYGIEGGGYSGGCVLIPGENGSYAKIPLRVLPGENAVIFNR